jgi:hypothetical protein
MNFINMIDDIVCGKFGNFETLESESKVDKVVTYMCKMLEDYLSADEEETDAQYYRQLALGENNVVILVLDVALILLSLDKKVPLRLLLSKLIKICKNNKVTQAQLFLEQGKIEFLQINKHEGLMAAVVTTSIFENNNEILYVNEENFGSIIDWYRISLEGLDMETPLNPAALKEREDCSKTVKKLLSLQKFNEYFEHMIDIEQVSSL